MSVFFQGEPVVLIQKVEAGKDNFGKIIYEEKRIEISNVMINQTQASEVLDTTDLTTGKVTYTLCIPKEDNHDWENCKVEFWGKKWNVVGIPTQAMEQYVPLDWNKKVVVELYE